MKAYPFSGDDAGARQRLWSDYPIWAGSADT